MHEDLGPADHASASGPDRHEVARAASRRFVAVCQDTWRYLQAEHPEIPDAPIVVDAEPGGLDPGHWCGGLWFVAVREGHLVLCDDALELPAEMVFHLVIHEAAHQLNAARGDEDTTHDGIYHTALFKVAAEKLGLSVVEGRNGWAHTTLTADGRTRHAEAIAAIAAEMTLARHMMDIATPAAPTSSRKGVVSPAAA